MNIEETKLMIAGMIDVYLTPYAIVLVVMGAVSSGLHRATEAALGIVVFTSLANAAFMVWMRRRPSKAVLIRHLRIGFNYCFNIILLYLLWPYWRPIWMLFLLSIVAIGIFEDRRSTASTAGMFTVIILFVHHLRGGDQSWSAQCEVIMFLVTIWTAGLLINRLTHGKNLGARAGLD
jgi:hypothetical protein